MNNAIIGMLAETCLHPGSGQTAGVIDLPVAEKNNYYPVIPGSGLKGHYGILPNNFLSCRQPLRKT